MPLQAPSVLIPILVTISLGNADISTYNADMKKPPWAVAQNQPMENERELKKQFAEYLLFHPNDTKGAAELVSNGDYGKVFVREKNWPSDPDVRAHQQKLIAEKGERYFIPTREQVIHNLWARVNAKTVQGSFMMEDKDMIAATRLIGELAGYVGKSAEAEGNFTKIVNQTLNINFVEPENKIDTKTIDVSPIVDSEESTIPGLKFVS